MLTYSSSVTIAGLPDEVFAYIVERDKQALWTDVPMRQLTEGPFRAGTRFVVSFGRPPIKASITLEVSAFEPGRRFAFTTVSHGPSVWDGEYLLEPSEPTATKLSQAGSLRFRGLWRLLEPIVGAEIRRNEIKELEKLKAVVERAGLSA